MINQKISSFVELKKKDGWGDKKYLKDKLVKKKETKDELNEIIRKKNNQKVLLGLRSKMEDNDKKKVKRQKKLLKYKIVKNKSRKKKNG